MTQAKEVGCVFPLHSLGSGDLYVDLYAVLVFNSCRLWESSTTRRLAVGSLHTVPEKWFCWNLQEDGAGVAVAFPS